MLLIKLIFEFCLILPSSKVKMDVTPARNSVSAQNCWSRESKFAKLVYKPQAWLPSDLPMFIAKGAYPPYILCTPVPLLPQIGGQFLPQCAERGGTYPPH